MNGGCFSNLLNLADAALGARVVGVSDDFFAQAYHLLQPGRGVFIEGKYTDQGKWMDGWESRRKRGAGHDWVILELGAPGVVHGFDIDTHHFVGNHPPFASVEGVSAPSGATLDELSTAPFVPLLSQVGLSSSSQNLFAAESHVPVNYLRLNIYPDGGVARFRAYGQVVPTWNAPERDAWTLQHTSAEWVDLAAALNGAKPLSCSNAHFSPMHQALLPGRSPNMGGGWETRRRRDFGLGAPSDWLVVELGQAGVPHLIEVDTQHFKGNYPDRCSVDGLYFAANAGADRTTRITDLITSRGWAPLVALSALHADARHAFPCLPSPAVTHVRLNIFPDGGISRLRVWGTRQPSASVTRLAP